MAMSIDPTQSRWSWTGDLASLIARVGIGLLWIAHGWPKIQDPSQVTDEFAKMGVFLPGISAWYSSIVEFVVALALIVGIGLPVAGLLLLVDALGAIYYDVGILGFLHLQGDSQLAFALGMGSLIAGFHGGRFALDRLIAQRRSGPRVTEPA
jgi:putative oxidoreductase